MPYVGRTVMALSDAWVIRDFRLFILGDTASKFGRAAFMTAVFWKVAEIGGPKAFGMLMTAYFLAHLPLIMVGGMLVDRVPRKRVALAMDLIQAVSAFVFIIMLIIGIDIVKVMIFACVIMGASTAFSMPAIQALVPDLVEEETLAAATGLHNASRTAAWSIGGLVGGLAIHFFGLQFTLWLDLLTFLISAAFLIQIDEVPIKKLEEDGEGGDFKTEMKLAGDFVLSQPWLLVGILAFMVFHIGGAVMDIGIPFIVQKNDWNAIHYGLWGATTPIGAAIGALYAGSKPIPKSIRGTIFYVTVSIAAWLDILYVMTPWFFGILLIALVQGLIIGVLGVIWNTTIGDSVDQHLRGRVFSIDAIGSFLFIPFAPIMGGYLIEEIGLTATVFIAVSIMVASTIIGIIVPSFRRFERVETEQFPIIQSEPSV
jgi:DHA3 family macrolide efflux protein-like MFS transporter